MDLRQRGKTQAFYMIGEAYHPLPGEGLYLSAKAAKFPALSSNSSEACSTIYARFIFYTEIGHALRLPELIHGNGWPRM